MNDQKVFCKDCKFFDDYFMGIDASCSAEGNKKHFFDWRQRYWSTIRHPNKINKFNDCRWYVKKDTK